MIQKTGWLFSEPAGLLSCQAPETPLGPHSVPVPGKMSSNPDTLDGTLPVRVIKDGEGTVLQRFDYYPFGSESRVWTAGTNTPQSALRYRFGGKEIAGQKVSVSTGAPAAAAGCPYLDFGARLYDPRTAAWLSQDPLSEKYYSISPYAYCAGNPVNLVDPNGNGPVEWIIKYYVMSHRFEYHSNTSTLRTIGFSMRHPYIAYKIGPGKENYSGISAIAGKFAINIMNAAGYNSNLEGTPKNAFRHVLWQTLITTEYGEETAIRVGNAHEVYSIIDYNQRSFKKIEDADTSVDLHNNAIGRQIALDNPGSSNVSLALKVLYHFHTQGLWVVERGKDEFVIYQQKLSDDEYQKAMEELIKLHQDGLKH